MAGRRARATAQRTGGGARVNDEAGGAAQRTGAGARVNDEARAAARRPLVSVVMPFAGDRAAAEAAIDALHSLDTVAGDELIVADNSGTVAAPADIIVVRAAAERSPAHARNAGARRATRAWILFLDSDCRPRAGLLAAYFAQDVAGDVGALAGEVRPAQAARTLAGRYGARRSFLSQRAHLAHPFRPRAVAANLLVRRDAFEQLGGFYEGLRAAEDTDFSWRMQEAGWRLELRSGAWVEHRYRANLSQLRRQWRGYAAGRAWLARRYAGFRPESPLRRAPRRALRALRPRRGRLGGQSVPMPATAAASPPPIAIARADRARFLVLDGLLGVEELVGLTLSNRPRQDTRDGHPAHAPVAAVLVAERFPAAGDPLVELARTLGQVRVEAAARPRQTDLEAAGELEIVYREDDGAAARVLALIELTASHPLRCLHDRARRASGQPSLLAIAPAARRLARLPTARVLALGGEPSRALAQRLAALAGRPWEQPARGGRRSA